MLCWTDLCGVTGGDEEDDMGELELVHDWHKLLLAHSSYAGTGLQRWLECGTDGCHTYGLFFVARVLFLAT